MSTFACVVWWLSVWYVCVDVSVDVRQWVLARLGGTVLVFVVECDCFRPVSCAVQAGMSTCC